MNVRHVRSSGVPGSRLFALLLVVALILTGSLASMGHRSAGAENEGAEGGMPIGPLGVREPIMNMVSGAAWTNFMGYDPRFYGTPGRNAETGFQWTGPGMSGADSRTNASSATLQQVPFRNPAPSFSRNQIVTKQLGLFPIQTEPHVAVDPNDPQHLVLGVIDYNFPSMSTYVTWDGGETWEGPHQVRFFREDVTAAGDPVLAFGSDGSIYLTFISLGFEEVRIGTILSFTEVSSMAVAKSLDGGYTWTDAVSAARGLPSSASNLDGEGRERGTITLPFLDKPWIDVGPDPENPDGEIIHLSYTDFSSQYTLIYSDELPYLQPLVTETTIRVVSSRDGGVTWSEPTVISPVALSGEGAREPGSGEEGEGASEQIVDPTNFDGPVLQDEDEGGGQTQEDEEGIELNRTVQGSQPKVMSDGTLVVAYLDTTNDGIQEGLMSIMVTLSSDGGVTFSDPVSAGIFREPHFRPRNSTFRYWGTAFPQMAIGTNDEVYIAVTGLPEDKPTDDGDIYLMRSLDKGQSWDTPVRVNQDPTDNPQFFPSVDVSPDGMVHIMWGDMRDDPQEVRYNIYYTRSEDQGETFGFTIPEQNFTAPDTRVTDFGSNSLRGFPNGAFIGDYFSLAATDGDVYMVWADTRLGEFGGANQQIAFARQTAIPPAELFLNPPSGSAGRVVDIQGFGFQPNSLIQLLVSGVIVANVLTDGQGQFQTSIYMPLTGEGPTSISAFDETGNVATASFYTEFGFDSLQESLESINNELDLADTGSLPGETVTAVASPAAASPVASPVASPAVTVTASAATPVATPISGDETVTAVASPVTDPDASPRATFTVSRGTPTSSPTPTS